MDSHTRQLDPYSPEGCFIATAAYGTETHQDIDVLRGFRDKYLKEFFLGKIFVKNYYRFSPPIANFIAQRKYMRHLTRLGLVKPLCVFVDKFFD